MIDTRDQVKVFDALEQFTALLDTDPLLPKHRNKAIYDGMEAHVAKIEASMDHMQRDVADFKSDMRDVRDRLARVEERVSHLPSKGFIVAVVITAFTLIGLLTAFQPAIRSLFNLS